MSFFCSRISSHHSWISSSIWQFQSFFVFYGLDTFEEDWWLIFCRMPFSLGLFYVFSWFNCGYASLVKNIYICTKEAMCSSQCRSGVTWCWYIYLLLILTFISWLNWCLMTNSTVKFYYFFSLKFIYILGRYIWRVYEYLVSPQTFLP